VKKKPVKKVTPPKEFVQMNAALNEALTQRDIANRDALGWRRLYEACKARSKEISPPQ